MHGYLLPFRNPFLRDVFIPIKRFLPRRKVSSMMACRSLGETVSLPGVYFVIGCGDNGITFSMLAVELIDKWQKVKHDELSRILAID